MDHSQQDASAGASHELFGLDADSYTARRLQHSSHSHLHATSRRCFIGPIPEAWLSRHRKSWYKHRPHLSTYSSRTATFDASANISYSKQLSGLESSAATGHYSGPSFPQPDDISAEEPITTIDPSVNSIQPASEELEPPVGAKLRSSKQVGFQIPSESTSQAIDAVTRLDDAPYDRDVSNARKPSSFSEAGKTFVTAEESLSSKSAQPGQSTRRAQLDVPRNQDRDPLIQSNRQSAASSVTQQNLSTSRTRASVASTSPLLRLQSSEDEPRGAELPQHNAEDESPEATARSTEQQVEEDRLAPTAHHAAVHFNIVKPPHDDANVVHTPLKETLLRSLAHSKTEPGELIKAERMLVRVDWTKHELPPDFTENDSLRIESSVVEKWREFMVVCRKSIAEDDDEDFFVLHMSKTRVIPLVEQQRTSKRSTHSIMLQRRVTRINMYSSLDKSIVLWHSWRKGTRIYVLRPRSSADAVEWYTFLNTLLGWKRPQTLNIHVPDLNVSIRLDRPFQALRALQDQVISSNVSANISTVQDAAREVVAHDIISRCVSMLSDSPMSETLKTWLANEAKVGLAWKRYDRLEWVHGTNEERMYGSMAMQTTHDLELRPKQHYPTRSSGDGVQQKTMEEPAAVEGFLVRLTSQRGRQSRMGKSFFKRLYFSSHDQYLCFSIPGKALPPKPPKLTEDRNPNQPPKAAKLAEAIPMIYAVNPYPLKDGQVSWLRDGTANSKKYKDELAEEEAERKLQTLLQAQGYIDLCQVKEVRRAGGSDTTFGREVVRDSEDEDLFERGEHDGRRAPTANTTHVFELELRNGLVIRLQAYDSFARDEWVRRIRQLSKYWKMRIAEDTTAVKSIRRENMKRLEIDEEMESSIGQFAQKWEVTRAVASAELFNMCGISCCRSVTMSGILFYKPRLHARFRRCSVILCRGKLLIFEDTLRQQSGKRIAQIHHERLQTIDLQDTYMYSGLATDNDLLYQNQTFDSNHPGHHALPRVYLEDNWTSSDEDTTTCFVIWHGKSRSLFRAIAQQEDGSTRRKLRYVSSLGRPGRSIVFKARSRAERDVWVTSIGIEVERLQRAEDLRVIEDKG